MIESFINNSEEKSEVTVASRYKKVGMIFTAFFLVILIFTAAGCTGGGNADITENVAPPSSAPDSSDVLNTVPDGEDIMVEPGSVQDNTSKNSKADVKDDDIDIIANNNDKMVTMTVEATGRSNPFVPAGEFKEDNNDKLVNLQKAKLKYDLIDPPNAANADSDAQRVLTTKVSGVMYDAQSPSAILNIEGSDFLVRSGDVVNGYKVLAISPTVVTVQLGANVYKAGVGELLTTDGIQYNTISNLSSKFGGGKK